MSRDGGGRAWLEGEEQGWRGKSRVEGGRARLEGEEQGWRGKSWVATNVGWLNPCEIKTIYLRYSGN